MPRKRRKGPLSAEEKAEQQKKAWKGIKDIATDYTPIGFFKDAGDAVNYASTGLYGPALGAALYAASNFVPGGKIAGKALQQAIDYGKRMGVSPDKMLKTLKDMNKSRPNREKLEGPLGKDAGYLSRDMQLEAKLPQLSTTNKDQLTNIRPETGPWGQGSSLNYRPYQAPDGRYVHSTYGTNEVPVNVLGGTGPKLPTDVGHRYKPTVGGQDRPAGDFNVVTDPKHKLKKYKLRDLRNMQKYFGPLGGGT